MGENIREISMPMFHIVSSDGIPSDYYFIILESPQLSMPIKKAVNKH